MVMPWLNMVVLGLAACCNAQPAPNCGKAEASVVIVRSGDDGQATAETGGMPVVRVVAAPRGQHVFAVATGDDESLPKVWIGVRLTAVPAPLAAHIGERGVMIANVVKNSPADQAGLQQYDVVVSFGGQDISRPQDLTAAIGKTEAGQAAKLSIVRKGGPQELTIKSAQRPGETDVEWKYTEPQDAAVDAAVKMYGRALQRDPSGTWTMKDLGQLRTLPEALEKLKDLDINMDQLDEHLKKLQDSNIFEWHTKDGESGNAGDDKQVRVEVKIKVDDDGKKIMIQTDADGKIQVTHTDADGKETSATYDNAEDFEKADPEAYEVYSEHCVPRGAGFIFRPFGPQTRKLRHEFQVDVEKKLEEAAAAARKARVRAGQARDEATEKALKEYEEMRAQTQAMQDEALKEWRAKRDSSKLGKPVPGSVRMRVQSGSEQAEAVMVQVGVDGSIKVVVRQDGEKTEREFKSMDEFKSADPELFAKVKDLLE